MKTIVVLSFNTTPERMPALLTKINPPGLPGSNGEARIAIGPEAKYVETWLDDASSRELIAVTIADATEILTAHQRQSSEACLCGWAELGQSHAAHQAEKLAGGN